ncbi:MAG: crossover junction endodeoxyribonuclease RuvC [Lewinellaceae bacterium]|nr:crossover junction endodeoxyribonuclease RuvC [Saprospiraceae bacterium]MCB9340317.1 crossover junction endodeoxyribonuclease RuvC [Lewinellaceae bacterium]
MAIKEKFRLLGVDPGSNVLGYAIIEVENKAIKLLDMGAINMRSFQEQQHKLKKIFEDLQLIIGQFQPKEMAIEAPFYGNNVQSMLKLGRAQGVAIAAAITKGVAITEYSPKKIKQAVTGNGNASKEQVAAMLKNILKQDIDSQSLDATDALATVICHYFQSDTVLGKGGNYKDWSAFIKDNPQRKG